MTLWRTPSRGAFPIALALLLLELCCSDAQGIALPQTSLLTLKVWHKLPHAPDFTLRGEIAVPNGGREEGTVAFVDKTPERDVAALRELVAGAEKESAGELYRVLVRIPGRENVPALSVTSLCMIRSASLNDEFIVHVDENGEPFHVDYNALAHDCKAEKSGAMAESFSTLVKVVRPSRGPRPLGDMPSSAKPKVEFDKEGNIKKPELEKSFIQKYWMYLVPVLIMFLLSPSEPPNQGGNAGGGATAGSGGGARPARS